MKIITIQDTETMKWVKYTINDKTWEDQTTGDSIPEFFQHMRKHLNEEINRTKNK